MISIDISKDGLHLISGGSNYEIKIYSILEDSSISVESQQRSVSSVKFSPKKTYFATTDYTYAAYIWRFDTKEIIKTLTGHSDRIRSIKFSLDETMLITASKDTIIRI